jgi:hypothetical protein
MEHKRPVAPRAVQWRLELAFARFAYDWHAGAWRRGSLTVEHGLIDMVDDDSW